MKRRRPRCPFRVHIDHIDNPKGDVWAVSYGTKYLTAHSIEIVGVPRVVGCEVRQKQPRAFLSGVGAVSILWHEGKRTIRIEGVGA